MEPDLHQALDHLIRALIVVRPLSALRHVYQDDPRVKVLVPYLGLCIPVAHRQHNNRFVLIHDWVETTNSALELLVNLKLVEEALRVCLEVPVPVERNAHVLLLHVQRHQVVLAELGHALVRGQVDLPLLVVLVPHESVSADLVLDGKVRVEVLGLETDLTQRRVVKFLQGHLGDYLAVVRPTNLEQLGAPVCKVLDHQALVKGMQ